MKDKMKNIHILPTDKPSRLWIWMDELRLGNLTEQSKSLKISNQNIYITSDEEIKEGDCGLIEKEVGKIILTGDGYEFLIGKGVSYEYSDFHSLQKVCKKIILTTDQDLIKDGVQAIDDDFLEWFIKNPSCEEVELEKWTDYKFENDKEVVFFNYKIIIPKEEPKKVLTEEDIFNQKDIDAVTDYINKEEQKQHLIDMMESDEELGLYDETIDSIKLEEVFGSQYCLYSVIENKLATLYRNQEKILSAIKILNNGRK